MASAEHKAFETPDETRTFENGKLDVISIGGSEIGRLTLYPGWRWSEHVKPLAGTELCEVPHFQYHVSGRLGVRMADGSELEAGPVSSARTSSTTGSSGIRTTTSSSTTCSRTRATAAHSPAPRTGSSSSTATSPTPRWSKRSWPAATPWSISRQSRTSIARSRTHQHSWAPMSSACRCSWKRSVRSRKRGVRSASPRSPRTRSTARSTSA